MKNKLAELLEAQYGLRNAKRAENEKHVEAPVRPFGPHKTAFYGLLVPVTAPRH